ncbi:MAG: L,D-transpeptidase [Blautia sp.]|nr:L,D-transpeptidase [Blautia sp.]
MENEGRTKKSKKKVALIVLLVIVLALLAAGGIYAKLQHDSDVYFARTELNGFDLSGLTPDQAVQTLLSAYSASTVTINEKGEESITGKLADFGYSVDEDGLKRLLDKGYEMQRDGAVETVKSLITGNNFVMQVPFSADMNALKTQVCSANLKEERIPSEDAYLNLDEESKTYSIVPEIYGNEIKDSDLQLLVKDSIDEFTTGNSAGEDLSIDMPENFYILPEVYAEDADLVNTCDVYNQFCKAQVTYKFGSQTEVLGWDTIREWLDIHQGGADLINDKLYEHAADLAARYNTRYHDRTFHTTYGNDVVIPGNLNEYGYTVDQDAEVAQLYDDIMSNAPVEREPVYVSKTDSYGNPVYYAREGRDDLAGTYVEVNLSAQHLWYYKNGGLVVESDIVSGCVSKGRQTQTGCFPLAYKESPSVLTGGNAANGYSTKVQYWMPFYEGQGLHDATWRGSFGGSIYQNNGSHGCVNLPYWAAETIFNNIDAGVAIIIFK